MIFMIKKTNDSSEEHEDLPNIKTIEQQIDELKKRQPIESNYEDIPSLQNLEQTNNNGLDNEPQIEEPQPVTNYYDDEDQPTQPEELSTALIKYQIGAEISKQQEKYFDINRAFHGRHVVNSNTKRMDNLRHLDAQDLCNIYNRIPTMRHRAVQIRMRETSEFQMCRSNPEIGGFDRKMQYTNIKREMVDVKQEQTMLSKHTKKTGGILGFLGKKKTTE
jgi:hypothetical protein